MEPFSAFNSQDPTQSFHQNLSPISSKLEAQIGALQEKKFNHIMTGNGSKVKKREITRLQNQLSGLGHLSSSWGSSNEVISIEDSPITPLKSALKTNSLGLLLGSKKAVVWDKTPREEKEFHREIDEHLVMFSKFCPYFPEVHSEESALALLDELNRDPYVSPFIPKSSKISCLEVLSITYERIKLAITDSKNLNLIFLYLKKQIEDDPELLEQVKILLQNNRQMILKLNHFNSSLSLPALQEDFLLLKNEQPNFLGLLSSLIPLKEVAKIKCELDLIKVVDSLKGSPTPSFSRKSYEEFDQAVQEAKQWLDRERENLSRIETLDLSKLCIETFSLELIPYLTGVHTLTLKGNPHLNNPKLLANILKLPALQHLDFSSNGLVDICSESLVESIDQIKKLKTLDLSGNPFTYQEASELINLCASSKPPINLILNSFSKMQDDHIAIASRLKLPIPKASLLDPQMFFEKIQSSLENKKEILSQINSLDLSKMSIQEFPEVFIPYLSEVSKITLTERSAFPELVQSLSKFPNLESLDLSSNDFEASSIQELLHIIETMPNLSVLNLSNNPFDKKDVPNLLEYCDTKQIALITSLTKELEDLVRFLNILDLHIPNDTLTNRKKLLDCFKSCPFHNLKGFNFSRFGITTLLEDLVPFLVGLKTVDFANTLEPVSQTLKMMTTLLKLPNLESVNFSNNKINDESLIELLDAIKGAKKLKEINLGNNPFTLEAASELIEYCCSNNIRLFRPYSKKENDLLSILTNVNTNLSFIGAAFDIPEMFVNAEDILRQVLPVSEALKKSLERLSVLDLSRMHIETFPLELIPYFSQITTLYLDSVYPTLTRNHQPLTNLLQLPQLKTLFLSNNILNHSLVHSLANFIQTPESKIEHIDIQGCKFYLKDLKNLDRICRDKKIRLSRDLFNEELDLLTIFNHINAELSTFNPQKFLKPTYCLDSMSETDKEILRGIEKLNLSYARIDSLPQELLPYFSGIKMVVFQYHYKTPPENFNLLKSVLAIPNIESIDLSRNQFGGLRSLPGLIEALDSAKNLKVINFSHTDIKNDPTFESLISYCNTKGITCTFS